MDAMFRKFFHVGLEENNASTPSSGSGANTALEPAPIPVVVASPAPDSVAVASFGDLETQLDVFEGVARTTTFDGSSQPSNCGSMQVAFVIPSTCCPDSAKPSQVHSSCASVLIGRSSSNRIATIDVESMDTSKEMSSCARLFYESTDPQHVSLFSHVLG